MATRFEKAQEYRRWRIGLMKNIRDSIFILIGVFSAAFGLEGFLLKNQFIDGGATGVSLLISGMTGVSLSLIIVLVNIPFMIMGYNHLGKIFAIKTCLAITLSLIHI